MPRINLAPLITLLKDKSYKLIYFFLTDLPIPKRLGLKQIS